MDLARMAHTVHYITLPFPCLRDLIWFNSTQCTYKVKLLWKSSLFYSIILLIYTLNYTAFPIVKWSSG